MELFVLHDAKHNFMCQRLVACERKCTENLVYVQRPHDFFVVFLNVYMSKITVGCTAIRQIQIVLRLKFGTALFAHRYYRPDGTCNNPLDGFRGAVNHPFKRLLPAAYFDGKGKSRNTLIALLY